MMALRSVTLARGVTMLRCAARHIIRDMRAVC
jgi:hypothetical protein